MIFLLRIIARLCGTQLVHLRRRGREEAVRIVRFRSDGQAFVYWYGSGVWPVALLDDGATDDVDFRWQPYDWLQKRAPNWPRFQPPSEPT